MSEEKIIKQDIAITKARATTPRAAAVAGILFSVLLLASLVLVRITVPPQPQETGAWLSDHWQTVDLGLNLVPFAGIAFLWFIGVVRDRLGEHEDRFFATVFLGSGMLFLAMLFASAAVAGGIISMFGVSPGTLVDSGLYAFGRTVVYELMTVYTMKMAGVFMMTTCTLSLRTGIFPRWMAFLGIALALFLLLSMSFVSWSPVVFPLWILLISIYILWANLKRQKSEAVTAGLD